MRLRRRRQTTLRRSDMARSSSQSPPWVSTAPAHSGALAVARRQPARPYTRASCDELRFCRLVKRCHKPDRKEFTKVAVRTGIGFIVMGFVGFFLKLVFIPINNIIVGSG